jgi:hypothetical protein
MDGSKFPQRLFEQPLTRTARRRLSMKELTEEEVKGVAGGSGLSSYSPWSASYELWLKLLSIKL